MRTLTTLTAVMIMTSVLALAQTADWRGMKVGEPPSGWTCGATGPGEAKWTVVQDDYPPHFYNVLKQSGSGATATEQYPQPSSFPICTLNDVTLKDGFVQVNIKALGGKQDQAGGLIWRVQDDKNYYIARLNGLERNINIYSMVDGKRTLKVSVEVPVVAGVWHTLHVDITDDQYQVFFDGKQVAYWYDKTFLEPGKIGVLTKADSQMVFDLFQYCKENCRIPRL